MSTTLDNELCLYSLNMAKNLVQQTILDIDEETAAVLDTDTSAQNVNLDSPPNLKMCSIESLPVGSSKDIFDNLTDIGSFQTQVLPPVQNESTIEMKSATSYTKESQSSDLLGVEEDSLNFAKFNSNAEPSISKIFERAGSSESSIFPFSMLGESPEVLYEKYSKEGYLSKKATNMFVGWQKRFFEVRGFKIYYSKSMEMLKEKKQIRCINLFVNPCQITEVKGQTFQISIEGVKKKLRLKADSLAEAKAWIDFFEDLFKFVSDNQVKANKYITAKREKLLKLDILTEEEFIEKAETGDILLFQSFHFAAKMQRAFTHSKYDHVGIIVRAFEDVYLYDSVLDGGVQLTNWKDFKTLEYHKDYKRIAYRKLEIKDPILKQQIQDDLYKFVTDHTGRKYDLSLKKLLKRTSRVTPLAKRSNNTPNQKDNVTPSTSEEGFFCSELVAAAYKAAGMLDPVIASSRYFPVSFSQKRGLNLLKGVELSNEYGLALTNSRF